jgi:hypothetical protein
MTTLVDFDWLITPCSPGLGLNPFLYVIESSLNARHEYEFIANFRVMQNVFKSKRVEKARSSSLPLALVSRVPPILGSYWHMPWPHLSGICVQVVISQASIMLCLVDTSPFTLRDPTPTSPRSPLQTAHTPILLCTCCCLPSTNPSTDQRPARWMYHMELASRPLPAFWVRVFLCSGCPHCSHG